MRALAAATLLLSGITAAQPGSLIVPPPEPLPVQQSPAHAQKMRDVSMALKQCDSPGAAAKLAADPRPSNAVETLAEEIRRIDLLLDDPKRLPEALNRFKALVATPDLPEHTARALERRIAVLQLLTGQYAEMPAMALVNDPLLSVVRLLELGRKDEAQGEITTSLASSPHPDDEYAAKVREAMLRLRELAAGRALPPGSYTKAAVEIVDPLARVRVAAAPLILKRVAPQYPRAAMRDGLQGFVELQLFVDETGKTRSARVLRAEPRGVFDAAALQAILQFTWIPAYRNCKPAPSTGVQPLQFSLEP